MKPNVLIIMTDDQGPWAMGCAGTKEIVTPSLDTLAQEGMRFTNCYCASPVCSPARAAFLTGSMPSSNGVHDWLKSGNIDVDDGVTWCGKDRSIEYLQGIKGFTDHLAAHGYLCGLSGKWHLGASGTPQKSHDFWATHSLGGDEYTDYFVFDNEPNLTHQSQYVTDFFTDRALDFLDTYGNSQQPFCLSVHYTAPHAPWYQREQPEDIWNSYESCTFPSIPVLPPHPWGGWDPTPEKRHETLVGYATAITAMDRNVARILTKLDDLQITENTLVIFTSDNGYNLGHHGIHGKGNGTFPLNMFAEAVKVPFIVRLPGLVPPQSVSDAMISHYDFLPTLLDLVGINNPDAETLPGSSFLSVLKGNESERESIVVYDEYGPTRMICDNSWKYIHRYPYGPHELYDLKNDPGESNNLVDETKHEATLQKLRLTLEEWFTQYVDPAKDGAKLPVTGKGQLDYADLRNEGRRAFEQIPK